MKQKLILALFFVAAMAASGGAGFAIGRAGRVKLPPSETTFTAYLTGYSYFDNTPERSAAIAFPRGKGYLTVHDEAGGTGTYNDPITLAVGHSMVDGSDTPDIEPGSRFYVPDLEKYFVAEDICGDGNTPQDGPCHSGYQDYAWLDVWVGGQDSEDPSLSDTCEARITGLHVVIESPSPRYPVRQGSLIRNAPCA